MATVKTLGVAWSGTARKVRGLLLSACEKPDSYIDVFENVGYFRIAAHRLASAAALHNLINGKHTDVAVPCKPLLDAAWKRTSCLQLCFGSLLSSRESAKICRRQLRRK